MQWPETLSAYPFPVVRLACLFCPWRKGRYRLSGLIQRYGPDADLDDVRRDLAKPCPRLEYKGTSLKPGCRATYPDLGMV